MAAHDKLKQYYFLVVLSNVDTRERISLVLEEEYPKSKVFNAADSHEGIIKLQNIKPSLLITDLDMPNKMGQKLIHNVLYEEKYQDLPVVALTSQPLEAEELDDYLKNKIHLLSKPIGRDIFLEAVLSALSGGVSIAGQHQVIKGDGETAQTVSEIKESTSSVPVTKNLEAGEVLFREGDLGTNCYLVRKGKLRVLKENSEGENIEIGIIYENEFVGEMAFLDQRPRSATVEVVEGTELVQLPMSKLDPKLLENPAWSKALIKTLVKRLRETKVS